MAISTSTKQTIASEFQFVAKRMRDEAELPAKVYYFSGTYAMIQRLFNLEFDSSLVLIYVTLHYTYNLVNQLLARITTGEEKVITFPQGLFDKLADSVEELGTKLVNNDDITGVVQKIATIGYMTTGNGYYMYQKHILGM